MSDDLNRIARRALPLIDLTSLGESDTAATIETLAAKAVTPHGRVAAVCIYARFVPLAKARLLGSGVKIAAVANFPEGGDDVDHAMAETADAIALGADEVDVVLPYRAYLAGRRAEAVGIVAACRQAAADHTLKVILETGALEDPALIAAASRDAIAAGADFIKTSTGKGPPGASLEAARAMLGAIKETGGRVGFKASGGIRTARQAAPYLALADEILGDRWATPARFRFGASGLLDDLLALLSGTAQPAASGPY